jgi:uncharacterized protein (TIGR02453 family)
MELKLEGIAVPLSQTTPMAHFTQDFHQFFMDLAPNNHKDWFDQNRKRYESNVKKPFKQFVEHMIDQLAQTEPELRGVEAKNCIFRINRDIRFSKDKTPYKTQVSAFLSPTGKKDHRYPGLYMELGPERLAIAGGAYFLPPEELLKLRQHIYDNPKEWMAAVADDAFLQAFPDGRMGEENKRIPSPFMAKSEEVPLLLKKKLYY